MARKKKPKPIDTTRYPMADRNIPEMSVGAKMRRRQFVIAYMKTADAAVAYFATGYKGKHQFAQIKGQAWLREPYVQMLLYKLLDRMDEEEIVSIKEVLLGLKTEAKYQGEDSTHSARVGAWAQLGRIIQQREDDSKGAQVAQRGNVIVLPESPKTPEDWEALAAGQQSVLKDAVKSVTKNG